MVRWLLSANGFPAYWPLVTRVEYRGLIVSWVQLDDVRCGGSQGRVASVRPRSGSGVGQQRGAGSARQGAGSEEQQQEAGRVREQRETIAILHNTRRYLLKNSFIVLPLLHRVAA